MSPLNLRTAYYLKNGTVGDAMNSMLLYCDLDAVLGIAQYLKSLHGQTMIKFRNIEKFTDKGFTRSSNVKPTAPKLETQ